MLLLIHPQKYYIFVTFIVVQADVLVNTIATPSVDLAKCCALAKAFLAAGGPELGKV